MEKVSREHPKKALEIFRSKRPPLVKFTQKKSPKKLGGTRHSAEPVIFILKENHFPIISRTVLR